MLAHQVEEAFFVDELNDREKHERTAARLRLIWLRRRLLFYMAVCGLALSTLVAFLIPNRDTSQTRLMPPDKDSGSGLASAAAALTGGSGAGLGGAAANLLGLNSTSDIFVGILTSRTVEDALIQKFDLTKVYGDRQTEDARKALAANTNIEVDRKSQIITIAVTDRNPQRAADIGRSYVEELDRLVAELSTSSARRERIFLEGRLQSVSQDLETAEKSLGQFASKNTVINVPDQGKAMVDAAANLQGQLIAAQSELEGLKQIYSDTNVRVRSLTARVDELQSQLNRLVGTDTSVSSTSGKNTGSAYPSLRELPLLGVTYADLYRLNKVQEAIYETLTQEYELAKVQEAKEIPTVKVLDEADVPGKKSYPPHLRIMATGTVLTFSAGIIWIFTSAAWRAADPNDPRRIFAQEVADTLRPQLPWASRNGSGHRAGNVSGPDPDGEVQSYRGDEN